MLQLWSHVDHDYDKIIRMFKQEYSNKNDRINKTIMLDVHSKVIIVGLLVYRAESIKKLPRKLKKSLNIINPKKKCAKASMDTKRFGYMACNITVSDLIDTSGCDLFRKLCSSEHSLHHLLPPERKYSNLRNRGHPYELPEYCTNLHKVFYQSIIVFVHLIF